MALRKDRARLWLAIVAIAAAMTAIAVWDEEIFSFFVPVASAKDAAAANLEDLKQLEQLIRKDRSFSEVQKAEFIIGLAELRAKAGTLSPAAFFMGVRKLVAIPRNGHTNANLPQPSPFNYVPLRLVWFSEGLYVTRATETYADLLGARVLAIDGRDVEDAVSAVRPYIALIDEVARNVGSINVLGNPALLKAIWPDTDGVNLSLRARRADGMVVERIVAATESLNTGFGPVKGRPPFPALIPVGAERDGATWRSVLQPGAPLPWALQEPTRAVFTRDLDGGGLYLRMNQVFDDDFGDLDDQLAAVIERAPAGGWRTFILDMRFNNGGDYTKSLDFTEALPKALHPQGKLYILTSNTTFSAAIVTIARIKHLSGGRTHIVGERVGDKDRFWAEGDGFTLKNSKITVRYSDGMHDWVNGCDDTCYRLNFRYGVAAGDLTPQTPVSWSYADYKAGRDTVLEKALELSRK